MYAPYFFGRQAELNAVAQLATDLGAPQLIVPLIEPVVDKSGSLKSALDKLKAASAQCYLIINPWRGKLVTVSAQATWATAFAPYIAQPALVRPVLMENPATTAADIASFVATYAGRGEAVLLTSNRLSSAAVASALHGSNTTVFLTAGVNPLPFSGALGASRIILVSDNFVAEQRNADYAGENWLASNHLTYIADGHPGFSDYTILPSTLSFTGGPVGAAAIHLTFKNLTDGSFWVQHFVSNETDRNVGNAQTKLLEAINHLLAQIAVTPTRFEMSPAILDYQHQAATSNATSLSGNKKLQIVHHLHTVGVHLGV